MKILLLKVGKTSDEWLRQGIGHYYQRVKHYLPFETKIIPDIRNAGKMTPEILKQMEGELILKAVEKRDRLVLLDEKGKLLSSREFAGFIEKQMVGGVYRLVFVIGGAWGFSEAIYERADFKISLSPMTFSHQVVRLLFAEQLYRALSILNNEPYHHD
jgi:23S rRNA (pseudouridine1915-N3)-methyltransferase